ITLVWDDKEIVVPVEFRKLAKVPLDKERVKSNCIQSWNLTMKEGMFEKG
ncbi:15026_t:CDS:2, partial [Racocetra persica]